MQDTSGVHVFLVLAKAFRALGEHAGKTLNLDGAGLGDSDFRVLEVLLHKGPLPVNTIRVRSVLRWSASLKKAWSAGSKASKTGAFGWLHSPRLART